MLSNTTGSSSTSPTSHHQYHHPSPPPPLPPPPRHIAPPAPPTPHQRLSSHFAAMFNQLVSRASCRGAFSSGLQSVPALRSSAPSTTLLQQRIWQRRGYATPSGMDMYWFPLAMRQHANKAFAQRRRTSLSLVAVLPDTLPPSRLARRVSRYARDLSTENIAKGHIS